LSLAKHGCEHIIVYTSERLMSGTNQMPGVWPGLLPNLVAGSPAALVALSYAALIFSGPELQPHLTAGKETTCVQPDRKSVV
jgi:hypothetical protein